MREVANSNLCRLLAQNKSFDCADVHGGDTASFYKASNRESAPRRRGPAKILDVADTAATAKFQSQTFKVARYCARGKADAQDVGEVHSDPASGGLAHFVRHACGGVG